MVRIWNCRTGRGKIIGYVPLAMWQAYAGANRWSTEKWIRVH